MAQAEAARTLPALQTNYSLDDLDGIKKALEDDGVVVIRDVISVEDCDRLIKSYRMWMRNFGTKGPDSIRSIIHKYNVGHLETTWEVRMLVKPVFEGVWGTTKLLSSFDGVAIGVPPEQGSGLFSDTKKPALHLDQGATRVGLHAYQGAVYLEQADVDDWCFQVITKTHHFHTEFGETFPKKSPSEFRRLLEKEIEWYFEQGCEHINVPVPKGGVVLWDSRLVHDGSPPIQGRSNPDRWRFVNFVSMTPAVWATEEDMVEKVHGYHTLRTSRHWSSSGFSLFSKYRAYPGKDLDKLRGAAKSTGARYLAGDLRYDFNDGEPNGPDWTPIFEYSRD